VLKQEADFFNRFSMKRKARNLLEDCYNLKLCPDINILISSLTSRPHTHTGTSVLNVQDRLSVAIDENVINLSPVFDWSGTSTH
jgi:hypothetical protein